ncbi:MAG: hypothetical protein NWS63_11425 [Saprospiraceae bacterium]|jgi:hypothetical protein|nr:hypothetical protein [Saprospiraceae bacterium]MDP4999062.1 hypothetical protein [Saprospiraceae bacterium]
MKELNNKTLQEGLKQLPIYDAPAAAWDGISGRLSSDQLLREALQQLPEYQAPAESWQGVYRRLQLVRRTRLVYQGLSAAATIALLVTLGILLGNREPYQQVTLSYGTEYMQIPVTADPQLPEDEVLIENLLANFDQTAFLGDDPEIAQLREEYSELKSANELLRSLIGQYGADPSLEYQLKSVEFQRSDLVKELSMRLFYFN